MTEEEIKEVLKNLEVTFQQVLSSFKKEYGECTLDEWPGKLEKLGKDGLIDAYFCLAVMYLIGYGVKKDIVQAFKWINVAVLHDKNFRNPLKFIAIQATPEEIKEGRLLFLDLYQDNQTPFSFLSYNKINP
ncbi:MAG: hypothetical protein K8953_07430 [Proteobacteria bacterium]|nr:hypothetical protein [Pseudomonadota bacterium]